METIGKLWHRGGIWARLAIVIIALWPVLITFAAFIGWSFLTAIVALLPLAAIVFGLIALIDPLVIAVIGTVWPKFLKTSALISFNPSLLFRSLHTHPQIWPLTTITYGQKNTDLGLFAYGHL